MKLKFILLSLIGFILTGLLATAQNDPLVADTAKPSAPPDPTPAAASTNVSIPVATSAGPAIAVSAEAAAVSAAPNPNADSASHPEAAAVIPLIVIDEVPLTDAIKNLARQANLNYMLDPKIAYGTPGPDGRVEAQPMISLRWENLTADQALNALLNTYNLNIINDPKTKVARITIKDPAAPEPLITKIIQLKYAYATNLMINAQSIMQDKRSRVLADARTSQLVVVATEKEIATLDELVTRLDTQARQVLIEARIIETSKNPTSAKGIDWSGTFASQHVSFGNGSTTGTYTSSAGNTTSYNYGTGSLPAASTTVPYIQGNPVTAVTTGPGGVSTASANGTGASAGNVNGSLLSSVVGNGGLSLNTAKGLFPSTAFLNADGVSAVLSFINNDLDGTVLSTPRAVTLDNEEAILSVTTAEPIFEATAGTQGSPGGSSVRYTNLGTILHVTPRISANNTIALKVIPEVSDIGGTVTKTVAGVVNQADFFDIRRITTSVLIPSGNTLVMGGLVNDNRSKSNVKVPILGDIPFLGAAFRQETKTQNKKNLIIFITPTVVSGDDFQPTPTDFLKTKMHDQPAADFGPWDSGKKQDWSKLFPGDAASGENAKWPETGSTAADKASQ